MDRTSRIPALVLAALGAAALATACGGGGGGSGAASASATTPPQTQAVTTPTPGGSASGQRTACDLASAAEVRALIGQDVTRQPAPDVPALSGASNCIYQAASGATVAIGLNSRAGFATAIVQGVLNQGGQPVAGLGDRAVLSQQGSTMAVNAAKGDVLVSLSISGQSVPAASADAFVRTVLTRI